MAISARLPLALLLLTFAGCAAQQRWNADLQARKQAMEAKRRDAAAAPSGGQGTSLGFCLAPAQTVGRNYTETHRWKVDYQGLGLKEAASEDATEGCDVVLVISHPIDPWKAAQWTYEARSARSKEVLWSGSITNTWSVGNTMSQLVGRMNQAFGEGTELRRAVMAERRQAGVVEVRETVLAPPERQEDIRRAERDGDAALESGNKAGAFRAYTASLTGAYSDDEASQRVRSKYMKLLASYGKVPEVPEEARRHMARAKAALKDAQGLDDYRQASEEMVRALEIAPWWSSLYYNIGLVAEKQGLLQDAIGCLKLYLLANPQSPDARAVQDKIYGLEMSVERASRR